MKCPFCTAENTAVKDSRPAEDNTAVRRRRACEVCGGRFTTFERVQLREITVVKRDGKRTLFDRDKVSKSVTIALRKRSIGDESVERLVSGIVRKLESSGETEVSSAFIGELVMEALKTVDPVGYVRYASVYKDFKDPSDFARFIETFAVDEPPADE